MQPLPRGHGVPPSPGPADIPHGWQPSLPTSSQRPAGSGPAAAALWRVKVLVGPTGQGAGGVAQQAGPARVVSHCQLSLPGWDCCSSPASRCTPWLHQAAPSSRQAQQNPLPCPKGSFPSMQGAPGHARSPSPAGKIRHGASSSGAPSLVQAPDVPHPALFKRVQMAGGCWVPPRLGSPQCKCSCHAVHTQALCTRQHRRATVAGTGAGTTSGVWRGMGKQLFALRGDCRLGATGQHPGQCRASAASTPVSLHRCPHVPPGAPCCPSSGPGTLL